AGPPGAADRVARCRRGARRAARRPRARRRLDAASRRLREAVAARGRAHGLRDPLVVEKLEVDPDVLDAARRRCAEAAAMGSIAPAARADLLACAVDLGEADVEGFLFYAAPEVRAAAMSLLAASRDRSWRARILTAALSPDAA